MGEKDLAGFDDCGTDFAEVDTDTIEHVRHSAYWAISTGRGQDWEEPDRWSDLFLMVEQTIEAIVRAAAATTGTDLEEVDARVERAIYTVEPGETMRWTANVTTARGSALVEGELQPLPQDVEQEAEATLPDPGPVAAGVKTVRQVAIDDGWFPSWLLGPNAGKIVYSVALLCDMATEWLYLGIQQRLPLVADVGALPHLGRDLGILRGLRESTDAYRRRLSLWVPTHRRAGTPFAIAEQIQAYFSPQSPDVYVVQHDPTGLTRATWSVRYTGGTETTIIATPTNFDWDSEDTGRPSELDTRDPRIGVVINQPPGGVAGIAGLFASRTSAQAATRDATAMNGAVRPSGAAAPADQYADLLAMVEQWRAMGTWVAWILVYFGTFDPAGNDASHPDGRWFDPLNDAKDGNRIPDNMRLLYVNRYPGDHLPASPVPYPV